MTNFSTDKTKWQSIQHTLAKCVVVVFCLFTLNFSAVFAETPSDKVSPRSSRVVYYNPIAPQDEGIETVDIAQTSGPRQNSIVVYEPVVQRNDSRKSNTRYTVARPTNETMVAQTSGSSIIGSERASQRTQNDLLESPLPELGGTIDNMEIRRQLERINDMSEAAKTGEKLPPETNTGTSPPATSGDMSSATNGESPGANTSGLITVKQIFQYEGAWYALKEGSNQPFPLDKRDERFFDENGKEVFLDNQTGTLAQDEKGKTLSSVSEKTRNAVLSIVTTIAVLAALSIGFLAFDYKRRWEQEIVNQNNRLLGGSGSSVDAFEPETLSFMADDYGSLDSSFDSNHSFRTIA